MIPLEIRNTIQRFHMAAPAQRILVGVSGGADSVCLLLALADLGYSIAVAHLNHGLRGAESDADEAFVGELSAGLGIPFYSRRVELAGNPGNIEAAGRQARKDFFAEIAGAHGFMRIALAHNRDDRVETFLLNLFRGAGLDGLVSMEPVAGSIIRPLIETSRSKIESYLLERGQSWRTDSSNLLPSFARNRLRLKALPQLAADFNPRLPETLTRTIEILADEDQLIQEMSAAWLAEHGTNSADGYVIKASALAAAPVALQRRVIRAALNMAGERNPALQDVTFEHVESARNLLKAGQSGKKVEIPGGLALTRSFEDLIVGKNAARADEFEYRLQIPGEVHIPELKRRFLAEIVPEATDNARPERVFVDGCNLGPYVKIRSWKPGDYYRPVGLPAGKLKKLFQRARIPRSQRHRWPVFISDSSIVWVASFPVSREFVPRGCSQKIVALEALPI